MTVRFEISQFHSTMDLDLPSGAPRATALRQGLSRGCPPRGPVTPRKFRHAKSHLTGVVAIGTTGDEVVKGDRKTPLSVSQPGLVALSGQRIRPIGSATD
jgi:hypothetical protein